MPYNACDGTLAQPGYEPSHVHSTSNQKCCKHCQRHKSCQTTLEPRRSSLIHKAERRPYKQLLKTVPPGKAAPSKNRICHSSAVSSGTWLQPGEGRGGGQLAHCPSPASSSLGFRKAQERRWHRSNRALQGPSCKYSLHL